MEDSIRILFFCTFVFGSDLCTSDTLDYLIYLSEHRALLRVLYQSMEHSESVSYQSARRFVSCIYTNLPTTNAI